MTCRHPSSLLTDNLPGGAHDLRAMLNQTQTAGCVKRLVHERTQASRQHGLSRNSFGPLSLITLFISLIASANAASPNFEHSELKRRNEVWSLIQGRKPGHIRCNKVRDCDQLVRAFLSREVEFVTPSLRTNSPSDGRLRNALGTCRMKNFDVFMINDSVKEYHTDKAVGPVTLYALPSDSTGNTSRWRIEFEDLRKVDPPRGKREGDLHGTKILNAKTCEFEYEGAQSESDQIDSGFFGFRGKGYRYLIGQPSVVTYYYVLIMPGGPDSIRFDDGIYVEIP